MSDDDDNEDWMDDEYIIDDLDENDTSRDVTVIVKMLYKNVSFHENIDGLSLEEVKELLEEGEYEDIADESRLEILEVLEVE